MNNVNISNTAEPISKKQQMFFMLFPVILFTVVEEWGGLKWALVLSIVYAIGELSWEWKRFKKVSILTLFSNLMVVGLSLISYYTQDGFWFKLQPAILELVMSGMLIGSYIMGQPMLVVMMKQQQNQTFPVEMESFFSGLTFRLGVFFLVQSALAAYAGMYWSTEIWAFLKTVGVLIMLVIYMFIEIIVFRKLRIKADK